jgi:hypothetical protein
VPIDDNKANTGASDGADAKKRSPNQVRNLGISILQQHPSTADKRLAEIHELVIR